MEQKKTNGHGGRREGSGRKKGGTNGLTIESLLVSIQHQSGQNYEQLLAEDFVHARANDRHLAQKYHHLILSKVAPSLAKIETTDGEDTVAARAAAFAQAIADLTKVK